MVFSTLFAIACSWVMVKYQQAKRQNEAVKAIENMDGQVVYDDSNYVVYDYQIDSSGNYNPDAEIPGPLWMRKHLGDGFFTNVISVHIICNANGICKYIQYFTHLQTLSVFDSSFTGEGLRYITDLGQLKELSYDTTQLNDKGLEHLKGLTHIQGLYLSETNVTDAGLIYLKGLINLRK
ncbi:MAG: hypothetical protein JXB10_11100 [Pirellulales bacterium]|nr:hypothetical protein [Pirellulales bacterium]